MNPPFLIGIAGASCSGKSSVTEALLPSLPGPAVAIGVDSYYHDISHLSDAEIRAYNLDEPAAIEHSLLVEHLRQLSAGNAIDKPEYDYVSHGRKPQPTRLEATPFIVVEGLFALTWPEVRDLLALSFFVDISFEAALARRVERDERHRGRMPESIGERFEKMVWPMARKHVLPTRQFADVPLDGAEKIEKNIEIILTALAERRGR